MIAEDEIQGRAEYDRTIPMLSSPDSHDLQSQTLRFYTVLCSLRSAWPGALILNIGLDPTGAALSLAANVAGAACLTLESDSALRRDAQRTGSCDFLVNTIDEALRPIKNELRKRRPLSVGLACDPSAALAEIVARGLAPELFTAPGAHLEAAAHFRSLGALTVSFHNSEEPTAASILEDSLAPRAWQLHTLVFANAGEFRGFDSRALALLGPDDTLRRQWLLTAGRILPRDRHRTLWLTPEEARTLAVNLI